MDLSKWKVGMAGRDDKGVLWRCMVLKPYAAMFARVTPSGSNVLAGYTVENEFVNQVIARGPDLEDEATAALTHYVPLTKEDFLKKVGELPSLMDVAGAGNESFRKAFVLTPVAEAERKGIRRRVGE